MKILIGLLLVSVGCASAKKEASYPEDIIEYQAYLQHQINMQSEKIKAKKLQEQLKAVTEQADEMGDL